MNKQEWKEYYKLKLRGNLASIDTLKRDFNDYESHRKELEKDENYDTFCVAQEALKEVIGEFEVDEILKKINSLSSAQKFKIYQSLRFEYVCEDVLSQMVDTGLCDEEDIDRIDVETVASKFVYDGEYDCNLSYWENIDNIIQEFTDFYEKYDIETECMCKIV